MTFLSCYFSLVCVSLCFMQFSFHPQMSTLSVIQFWQFSTFSSSSPPRVYRNSCGPELLLQWPGSDSASVQSSWCFMMHVLVVYRPPIPANNIDVVFNLISRQALKVPQSVMWHLFLFFFCLYGKQPLCSSLAESGLTQSIILEILLSRWSDVTADDCVFLSPSPPPLLQIRSLPPLASSVQSGCHASAFLCDWRLRSDQL